MAKPPTKPDVIKKYLQGDLERFLKRVYRYSKHELIYSVTFPRYERENPGILKEIKPLFERQYPGHVAQIINVHRVLVKYYGFEIDYEDIKLAIRIAEVLSSAIDQHNKEQYYHRVKRLYLQPSLPKPKQALKELIARGFIHINDFEGYNKNMAHIVSNANVPVKYGKLYFPKNFSWDAWSKNHTINKGHKWWDFTDVHLIHGVIGISGFTRILTPLDR